MISSESAVRRSPDGNEGNDPAVRLLAAITSAQKKALGKHDAGEIFEAMLEETLALTASAFGFMGEVLHSPEDKPFLKTHALTNISWNTETQALYEQHLAQELEFTNLDTLFGAALRTGDPVISNKPAHDPRRGGLPTGHPPIESFLGLPVYEEDRMIGLIGLANRPGGYDQEIIAFLAPLLTTCATLITFFRNDEARIGAENGLRKSEKRSAFQAKLLRNAPVIAAFHDTERNIVWANRAYEQATGQSVQDMEGKKCYSVWGLTKRCRNCTVVNALASGKTCEAELTPQTQDHWPESRGYWLSRAAPVTDGAGNTIGAIETATDIRALKQAEMERERFRAAINQAEDMIMITDREGTIEYVNPAFERITRYTAAEAIGENPRILKSGVQDDAFYRDFWETICSGNTFQGRMVNKGKGGALHTEEVMVSPVYDPAGGIVNFVAIKRDITEHLRISAQLQQAQKLEAIGTLAAGIAHDFNNILSVILGYSEAARAEVGEDSKAGGDLQHVITAADRAVDLVDQILAVSRQREREREPIAIQHIIKETLELLRPSISSLIEIRTNIDPECPEVLASPTEIHQVIMNLCTNAYQAMQNADAGNHVLEINLLPVELDEAATRKLALRITPGRFVKLAVSDTGTGMDGPTAARIFEPYFTSKEKRQGTGLGLSNVHSIVTASGGDMSVTSTIGQGSTFCAYLPAYEGTGAARKEREKEEARVAQGGTERIMLIDDEKPIADIMQRTLKKFGYRVIAYTSSVEAGRVFTEQPDAFDLVITDMNMPKVKGTELARNFLEVRPDIPILLWTGYSEETDHQEAQNIGIREILSKPVPIDQLTTTIRRVLDGG